MSELLFIDATEELQPLAAEAKRAGFAVATASLGEAQERLSRRERFDAVLLNLSDPTDMDAVGRILEADALPARTATLALVRREELDSLDPTLAVDDFLAVPATPEELTARLRRAIRARAGGEDTNLLRAGDLTIDQASYQVYVGSRTVDLTYKEYELLRFLAQNQDKVCTRETLLNRVWGYDFYGGARTVDVHIRRLRSKIEDPDHGLIETVRNVGYRLRAS